MSEVSLKRQRSPSNVTEEPAEKINGGSSQSMMLNPAAFGAMLPVSTANAVSTFSFYCQMLQQMQQQQQNQAELNKESSDENISIPARRQTISTPSRSRTFIPQLIETPEQTQFIHPIYNVPSFQRADEEIYTKFVESVRKLAATMASGMS